jgi:hypothetical protein
MSEPQSRRHVLRFTVEASRWDLAEHRAADIIRSYTAEPVRGDDARDDDAVLRDALFTAEWAPPDDPAAGKKGPRQWRILVEVTV